MTKYRRPSGRRISRPANVSSSGCSGDTGRSTSASRLRPMTDTRGCAVWLARPIIDTMMATTMPFSVPNTSTPTQAISAQRNSIERTPRIAKELFWLDQADRVNDHDCGQRGVRQKAEDRREIGIVASAAAAVTSEAFWDRPPAVRTTAVCEVPPPAGVAPRSAPILAAPVATSSRFGLIGPSVGRAKARPAAIVWVSSSGRFRARPGQVRRSAPDPAASAQGNLAVSGRL